jgi:pimeloyl-ACP methyl ester carboxylesterase
MVQLFKGVDLVIKRLMSILSVLTYSMFFVLSAEGVQDEKPMAVQFTSNGKTVHGLLWGKGSYGVILSHGAIYDAASWTQLAIDIAKSGIMALALEEVEPVDIIAAHSFLRDKYGVKATGLIGASAGGSTVLSAMAQSPQQWDQLILLSSSGDVSRIGTAPKLFVASEGEGMAEIARQMAKDSPGSKNDVLIVKGSAHAQAIFQTSEGPRLTRAILERLVNRTKQVK